MTTEKPAAPLSTSDGARCYIAHFFAREMRRHDFATYIATELAADFACALAQHLAARQPAAQVPVGQVRTRVDGGFIAELLPGVADRVSNMALLYVAAPEQGIDLSLTEEEREWIDYAIAHMRDDSEPEDLTCADALECLLRRIDGQRDAALGVGNV